MPKSNGFVHLIPLLLIATLILVVSFADFTSNNSNDTLSKQSVLSERAESDDNQQRTENKDKENSEDREKETKKIETRVETKSRESDDEIENESSDDQDIEEEVEIESDDETVKIKIKSKSNNTEFEFESEGVKAESNFPLSIKSETNELIVTTPNGEKVVTILPDQAVENMLDSKKITTVLTTSINEDKNGELEYQIEGQNEEKFLGMFNVKIHKKFVISASTGQEVSSQTDLLNKKTTN